MSVANVALPGVRPAVSTRISIRAGLLLILLAAAALRLTNLGRQSLWYDEAHTAWLVDQPLGTLLGRLHTTETTPPLYFLLTWAWTHLFGDADATLRTVSALTGCLTVPVMYALGARVRSPRAGLVAAALAATSPLLIWYSQEARSYALLGLLAAVSMLAFVELQQRPSRTTAIAWALAAAAAVDTHYYAALLIAPQAVWLLGRGRRERWVRLAILLALLGAMPAVAYIADQSRFLAGNDWLARVPITWRITETGREFLAGPEIPWPAPILGVTIAALAALATTIGRRGGRGRDLAVPVRLLGGGVALELLLLAAGFDQLDPRNLIALWVPAALSVAIAIDLTASRAVRAGVTAALCGVGVAVAVADAGQPRLERPDWRAVAAAVGRQTSSRGIFVVGGCQLLPLSLYLPHLGFSPPAGVLLSELDLVTVPGQTNWTTVLVRGQYVVCAPQPASPRTPASIGALTPVGPPQRVGGFRITRLRAPRPIVVSPRTIVRSGLAGELLVQRSGQPSGADGYRALAP